MPGTKEVESVRRAQMESAAIRLALESGLAAITIRGVAERASISPGLVIFHFGSKSALVLSVLDWVLAETLGAVPRWKEEHVGSATERLRTLVRGEVNRFSKQIPLIRLFFEFWSAGLRNPEIGTRIQKQLDRYREGYLPYSRAALDSRPARFSNVTAEGLAALCAGFVKGCAVQLMVEPKLANAELLNALDQLLGEYRGPTKLLARNKLSGRTQPTARSRLEGVRDVKAAPDDATGNVLRKMAKR